ncbi:hypothetical protein [Staphylococcus hominis]|nr:hypothetical protein [Staphylococcus hominis]
MQLCKTKGYHLGGNTNVSKALLPMANARGLGKGLSTINAVEH